MTVDTAKANGGATQELLATIETIQRRVDEAQKPSFLGLFRYTTST